MVFRIEYSPDTEEHLRALKARDRKTVLDAIEKHLGHQPRLETRRRKPMLPNPLAPWELRIGKLRVYYDVYEDPEPVVAIRAIGIKEHNRVWIGKQVFVL